MHARDKPYPRLAIQMLRMSIKCVAARSIKLLFTLVQSASRLLIHCHTSARRHVALIALFVQLDGTALCFAQLCIKLEVG